MKFNLTVFQKEYEPFLFTLSTGPQCKTVPQDCVVLTDVISPGSALSLGMESAGPSIYKCKKLPGKKNKKKLNSCTKTVEPR